MISYDQAYKELNILFKTYQDEEYSHHIFTTMFDYYALPTDFPDFTQARNIQDKYELIKKLESSFETAIDEQRFIPYIQLHEFESLVFCGLEFLKDIYPNCNKAINILSKTLNEFKNPELINHGTETAPSKRIIKAIESMCQTKYKYNKPKTGKYITGAIGIEALREKCPHFNEWIEKILNTWRFLW